MADNRQRERGQYGVSTSDRVAPRHEYSLHLTIEAATITENEATSHGGGLYARTGQFQLDGTRFENNTAGTYGGGVFFHGGDTTVCRLGSLGNRRPRWRILVKPKENV